MDGAINFTTTFSSGVVWHWPIAVYLLLAGMSGGALIVALLVRYYKNQSEFTPLFKAASVVAFITILLGMVCLVGDLDKPLYFWKILINYNFTSVMSIGVAALCIYIPLSFFVLLYAFEAEFVNKFAFLKPIFSILNPLRKIILALSLIFAVAICAYTGFLISVLVRFPILNTAVLPALFVASGLSAGIASSMLVSSACFGAAKHEGDNHILHLAEWPVMAFEILLIGMIFVSLILGSDAQKMASAAFIGGNYAKMFWFGVVGIGFVVPIVLNFALGKAVAHTKFAFYASAIASIIGVLMLRMFILYAGQSYSILG
ncbi:MAG: polysulfide reductase NrfD [Campylobacter sp.]|nr:polysulfide reductase NrfD [Campylobacter sp.]